MGAGRPPEVSDKEILELIRLTDDPVLTTAEIAQSLPIGQRAVLNRLSELHNQGIVNRKNLDDQYSVWWIPSSSQVMLQPQIQAYEQKVEDYRHRSKPAPSEDTVRELITEIDIPGSDETEEKRREAIKAAYEFLRNRREAAKQDFIENIFTEYGAGYSSARAWWEKLIRPALKQFPTVKSPPQGGSWEYRDQNIDPQLAELQVRLPDDLAELNQLLFDSWHPSQDQLAETQYRNIGKTAIRYLADNCILTKSEILEHLESQDQFESGGESIWSTAVQPALERAEAAGIVRQEVAQSGNDESVWTWQVVPVKD
jgi:DNA-binding Lrp family transcriptional regulator